MRVEVVERTQAGAGIPEQLVAGIVDQLELGIPAAGLGQSPQSQ